MPKYITILLFFVFLSCENTENDPHAGALPHADNTKQNVAPTQYTEVDKKRIGTAKGRSVKPLSYHQLANRLEFATGKLHVFNFWRLNCDSCHELNRNLEEIQTKLGEAKIRIIHINMDELTQTNDVNIAIRQQGLVGEIFQLEKETTPSGAGVDWNTELPALYLVNNAEEVKFYYQQRFTKEELSAIIQPLVL